MIVKNRATKKNHECKREDWDKMPDNIKRRFDIVQPFDTELEIPVVGTVKPNDTQTKKPKRNDY